MNQEEFIKTIKSEVTESEAKGIVSNLINPPGRKPSEKLLRMSKFYNSLDQEAQNSLNEIILDSVNAGVFGFLCVIDGVRSIYESIGDNGELKLIYSNSYGEQVHLNDNKKDFLHDIYNAE